MGVPDPMRNTDRQTRPPSPRSIASIGLSPPSPSLGETSQWGMKSSLIDFLSSSAKRSISLMRRRETSLIPPLRSQVAIERWVTPMSRANRAWVNPSFFRIATTGLGALRVPKGPGPVLFTVLRRGTAESKPSRDFVSPGAGRETGMLLGTVPGFTRAASALDFKAGGLAGLRGFAGCFEGLFASSCDFPITFFVCTPTTCATFRRRVSTTALDRSS